MKKLLSIIYLIIIVSSSCKKRTGSFPFLSGDKIKGIVQDITDGEPIPNAEVRLQSKKAGVLAYSLRTDTTVYADAQGEVSFNYDKDKNREYYLLSYHPYYETSTIFKVEGNKSTEITMYPYGWVKVLFIDEPPTDTLYSVKINGVPRLEHVYNNSELIVQASGNKQESYRMWYKNKKLEEFTYDFNVFIPKHDTVDYIFKF